MPQHLPDVCCFDELLNCTETKTTKQQLPVPINNSYEGEIGQQQERCKETAPKSLFWQEAGVQGTAACQKRSQSTSVVVNQLSRRFVHGEALLVHQM